jgi:putative ABC transport system permease protein
MAPDATPTQRAALLDEAQTLALEPVPVDDIDGVIGATLDEAVALFDALALIAVVVASLGIVNTLTMNVVERVREIGVLRAAGMTRRQVWRSVVVEAGITGIVGAVVGVLVGCVLGALLIMLAGGRMDTTGGLPWPPIAAAFGLGVVLAMLAAAYPARVASRIPIPRAVAYE